MEIERKFLVKYLPNLSTYTSKHITQAYISTMPVIRIRQADTKYFLTIKSKGSISREEYEMAITEKEFQSLWQKIDGSPIEKIRYLIPLTDHLTAELDVFSGHLQGLITVEVEFSSLEEANAFIAPDWFGDDISLDHRYKNNQLALSGLPER